MMIIIMIIIIILGSLQSGRGLVKGGLAIRHVFNLRKLIVSIIAIREFKDVVFEDVVFDPISYCLLV